MKAYIFKPSRGWAYCGGGLVILAKSFEEAQSMFDEKLWMTEEDANTAEDSYYNWILEATLDCPLETESKIVLNDYNWG